MDRGSMSWANAFRKEPEPINTSRMSSVNNDSLSRNSSYSVTDVMQGSLTFNVVAKLGYTADIIASEVFYALSAYKERFKEKGISKLNNVQLGRESTAIAGADEVKVTVVPVTISFVMQETLYLSEQFYNATVYRNGHKLVENINYVVQPNGTQILLRDTPEDTDVFTITYTDAITLEEVSGATLTQDQNNNRLYTVPNSGRIYGYYQILSSIELKKDSEVWKST